MNTNLNPDTEFEQLNHIVEQAQKDAEESRAVDLGDLAGRTDRLCTHISTLTPEDSYPFAGRLQKLVGDLDDLTELLSRLSIGLTDEPAKHQQGSVG